MFTFLRPEKKARIPVNLVVFDCNFQSGVGRSFNWLPTVRYKKEESKALRRTKSATPKVSRSHSAFRLLQNARREPVRPGTG